jgi:hypothetical protein
VYDLNAVEGTSAIWRRRVELGLAAVLAVAAVAKTIQAHIGRLPDVMGVGHTRLAAMIIEVEYVLAAWLIVGRLPRLRLFATISCFSIFASVAFYEAERSFSNCGCFGEIRIAPRITGAFDLVAVITLAVVSFLSRSSNTKLPSRTVMTITMSLLTAFTAANWLVYARSRNPDGPARSPSNAGIAGAIELDPINWSGRPFQYFDEVSRSDGLKTGNWILVFYHFDCESCINLIPAIRALANSQSTEGSNLRLALIAVPPLAPTPEDDPIAKSCPQVPRLSLQADHDWDATTPIVATLRNGVVASAYHPSEEDGTELLAQGRSQY